MRKLWYAGAAVASGFILFAASPARADEQPTSPPLPLLSGAGSSIMSGSESALTAARGGLDRVRRPTDNIHMAVPLDGSRPLGGLLPGGQPSADSPSSLDRPVAAESLPLLGDGLPTPGTPSLSDVSGLPGGGMAILAPAKNTPAPASADPRLHEEPIDPASPDQ